MLRQWFILGLQYDNKLPLTRKNSLPYDEWSTLGFHKLTTIKIKLANQNLFCRRTIHVPSKHQFNILQQKKCAMS